MLRENLEFRSEQYTVYSETWQYVDQIYFLKLVEYLGRFEVHNEYLI